VKVYCYNDWDENDKPSVKEITDQQILYDYWNYWEDKMMRFGYGSEHITHDRCIDDWIVCNWAWEKKHES
jgi:hypothetical protein